MKRLFLTLAAVSVLTAPLVNAQARRQTKPEPSVQQAPKTWDREPQTVFGIKLGGLVSDLSLPPCPPLNSAGFHDTKPTTLCILNSRYFPDKTADLFGTPDLAVSYHASLSYYKGFVSALNLAFKQTEFEKMKSILIERYGEPKKIDIIDLTAGSGAKLTSQQIEWKGLNTSIMAIERVGTIDQSYVAFSDVSVLSRKLVDQNSSNKKDADKF